MGSSGTDWKLPDHPKLPKGKVIGLIVLDGWGEANADQYYCIHVAETPMMDSLKKGGILKHPISATSTTARPTTICECLHTSNMVISVSHTLRIYWRRLYSQRIATCITCFLRCYSNNCKYKLRGRSYFFCGAAGVRNCMLCVSLYGHMKLQMQIFLRVHNDPSNAPVDGPTQWRVSKGKQPLTPYCD